MFGGDKFEPPEVFLGSLEFAAVVLRLLATILLAYMKHVFIFAGILGIALLCGCTTHRRQNPLIDSEKNGATINSIRVLDPKSTEDSKLLRAMTAISSADHRQADEQAQQLYRGMKLEDVEVVTGPLRKKVEDSFAFLAQIGVTEKDDILCSATNGLLHFFFTKNDQGEFILYGWLVPPIKSDS